MTSNIQVGKVNFEEKFLPIIAGPCVIENRDHVLKMAEAIREITDRLECHSSLRVLLIKLIGRQFNLFVVRE